MGRDGLWGGILDRWRVGESDESNDQDLWMALGRGNAKERTFPRMS